MESATHKSKKRPSRTSLTLGYKHVTPLGFQRDGACDKHGGSISEGQVLVAAEVTRQSSTLTSDRWSLTAGVSIRLVTSATTTNPRRAA